MPRILKKAFLVVGYLSFQTSAMTKIIPLYPHLTAKAFDERRLLSGEARPRISLQYELLQVMRSLLPIRLTSSRKAKRVLRAKVGDSNPLAIGKEIDKVQSPDAKALQLLDKQREMNALILFRTDILRPLPGGLKPGRA